MSGAANCPETPRQKMIGMMYLVLTAMLALNVSTEVLNGFTMVNDSLRNNLETSEQKNMALYASFQSLKGANEIKARPFEPLVQITKVKSDSLFNFIEQIKIDIAKATDGPEGNPDSLSNPGNLDAAGQIGIIGGKGKQLKEFLESYSADMQQLVKDSVLQQQFAKMFATGTNWESKFFESMPSAASITVLSKIQNDVRTTEAEVVTHLIGQIDAGDLRVNKIEAKVIPVSQQVVKDGKYSAEIILAASDSTSKPRVFVDGREIPNGKYEVTASTVGEKTFSGYIEVERDGKIDRQPFSEKYFVNDPIVTVSADLMNVFYSGYNNPVSISVPGISNSQLTASASAGSLTRNGDKWNMRPSKVGQDVVITVTATIDGQATQFKSKSFRVKALPPPVAFIDAKDGNGNPMKYKGQGKTISKGELMNAPGLKAELDDADLDVTYNILSFDTNAFDAMGNSIIAASDGSKFSQKQREQLNRLTKGKKLFITNIKAKGPDGIERALPPIEIALR